MSKYYMSKGVEFRLYENSLELISHKGERMLLGKVARKDLKKFLNTYLVDD
jgi:hypothetical protein